ncbi:MAG: ArsR/SmtB family transcription factor [Candidatus Bilamarchaeum sp.]|jgi:DNA-binding transcriptional ArsR family regulator
MEEEKVVLDKKSFEALSVDTRVKILKSLTQRRKTLSEVAEEQKMSVSGIKEHLETLEQADLVIKIDDGHKWKYYELSKKGRDIVGPKELKVWILLSMSAVALVVSLFVLMLPMTSLEAAPKTTAIPTPSPIPSLPEAGNESPYSARIASQNTTDSDSQTMAMTAIAYEQQETTQSSSPNLFILIFGISSLTLLGCIAILVKNRLRARA